MRLRRHLRAPIVACLLLSFTGWPVALAVDRWHPAGALTVAASPTVQQTQRQVAVVGHNSGRSLAVNDRMLTAGADMTEIDVRSLDGVLISSHLATISFGGVSTFVGPMVEEVWSASGRATAVLLDLKETSDAFAALVATFLVAHDGERKIVLASPDPGLLTKLAGLTADVALFQSVHDRTTLARLVATGSACAGLDGVTVHHELLDDRSVRRLRAAGFRVFAWTVNEPARAEALIELGVDGIITDSLDLIEQLSDGPSARASWDSNITAGATGVADCA